MNTLFVPCEACGREGRLYRRRSAGNHPDDEYDAGPCPECLGEAQIEVAAQPVTLEDLCDDPR